MSVAQFYLSKGYTLTNKCVTLSGAGTHSVWIPKTGHRVIVTGLHISSIDTAGTLVFYFDNGNSEIAGYAMAASVNFAPVINGWESTVTSGRIFATKNAIQTDGIHINLEGFEIPVSVI